MIRSAEAEAVNAAVWHVGGLVCVHVCMCFFSPFSLLQDLAMPWGRGGCWLVG